MRRRPRMWRAPSDGIRARAACTTSSAAPIRRSSQASRQAVFLDRDGTIIEDAGYLAAFDQIDLYPWTVDAIRALNRSGFRVIVVTNQSGIARGLFTEEFVQETHRRISARLEAGGA